MSAEIVKLLRKTPIFSTFDSSSLKRITKFFNGKTFSEGEVLFKEGTLGDTLYIIQEGAIKITRSAKEGEEETSRSLRREGDIFGESGFIDETPRPTTAQATKETKVLELSRSDFLTILNNDPLIAYQIVKVLSSRLKQSDLRQIEELKEKNEYLQHTCSELQKQLAETNVEAGSNETTVTAPDNESLYQRLLSYVPHPVILADTEDNVSFFNKAAEKEFGYEKEEIIRKPVAILWDETPWRSLSRAIEEEIRDRGMWEGPVVAKKSDGERFTYPATIIEVFDDEDKSQGKLYVSSRITRSPASEASKEPLDLKHFFEEELAKLRTQDDFRDISFVTGFETDLPELKANRRQMGQMLCAIMDNAAGALQQVSDRNKTITIEACGINDGCDVQIMISDNGVGISAENLSKVFREPFSTKLQGLGWGLLSVDRIVKDHHGSIEVHSEEGAYTLFIIKLPTGREKAASVPEDQPVFNARG
jgi:PAS domain S-box-containing protein